MNKLDNINIYVASFKQKDVFDIGLALEVYNSSLNNNLDVWFLDTGTQNIKAGDIIKITVKPGSEQYVNTSLFPVYLVAKQDYTITNMHYPECEPDIPYVRIPRIVTQDGKIVITLENSTSQNIWRPCVCNPTDSYATDMPWAFITEGVVTDYMSFQWNEKYSDVSSFTLTLPAIDENISMFQTDRYIMIGESEKIMIIEETKLNANLMADGYVFQVSGRSLESILDRRVAFPGMSLNSLDNKSDIGLIKALYDVVDKFFIHPEDHAQLSEDGERLFYYPERRVPFLRIPSEEADDYPDRFSYIQRPYTASINKNILKESILDVMVDTCKNNNLGFKIIPEPIFGDSKCMMWSFILYTGQDKSYNRTNKNVPPLIFSPTLNNVKAVATATNSSNYKNVIFCGTDRDASESYIDLMSTDTLAANLLTIKTPSILSKAKDSVMSKLQATTVNFTGALICALAANHNDKDYSQTVTNIDFGDIYCEYDNKVDPPYFNVYPRLKNEGEITPKCNWYFDPNHPQTIIHDNPSPNPILVGVSDGAKGYNFGAPQAPITKLLADQIKITYKITYGQDEISSSKTGIFTLSNMTGTSDNIGFKFSTSYGWLTSNILREATSIANAMPGSWSDALKDIIGGLTDNITKTAILAWFKTFDQYTTSGVSQTKWLCQEYNRANGKTGLDRREVFVEQENDNDDDWDASAIAAFKSSTTIIKTNSYQDDEDSDEEINEKLLKSAKKQSGNYNIQRDVDVELEYMLLTYKKDYDLGDIVQVDDGHNTLKVYMITGCTISNDTKDGRIMVPEFSMYDIIPPGYIQLEYLRVSNMLLPVRYCPSEDAYGTNMNLNFKTAFPDIGPTTVVLPSDSTAPESDPKIGYRGYIDGVINERRSTWTEFELEGGYIKMQHSSSQQDQNLKTTFALISAVGLGDNNGNHIMPYCLLSAENDLPPLTLGYPSKRGSSVPVIPEGETPKPRYFYQFIGDYSAKQYLARTGSDYGFVSCPGIGIKWEKTRSEIINNYLDAIYKVADDSNSHLFCLNKAIESKSTRIEALYPYRSPALKYSFSYIDDEEYCLAKRPQFQYSFVVGDNIWYYVQISDWEYGDKVDAVMSYNTYDNNPWTLAINQNDFSELSFFTPESGETYTKYIFLSSEYDTMYPNTDKKILSKQGMGAYGQIPFNIDNVENNGYYNNSYYRYVVLGGYAERRQNINSSDTIEWNMYDDVVNGVYIKHLKIYEYESSHRIYHYSEYERDISMVPNYTTDPTQPVRTWCHKWNGVYPGENPCSSSDFRNAQSGSENVDLSSRKLTHDYVPVKYTDYGDKEPENAEIYGLYDLIDNVFIPVNYCPDAEIFGEIRNSHAAFIDAGGEVPKY